MESKSNKANGKEKGSALKNDINLDNRRQSNSL